MILAENEGVVAVNKPAGLTTTPRSVHDRDCLETRLGPVFGQERLWAVHQLDVGTTGVNLLVTRPSLVAPWQERLRRGTKRYLAICHGRVGWPELLVVEPLARGPDGWMRVDAQGKPCGTLCLRLSVGAEASLVEARPLTGRTHQVRVHLAWTGHPLVGEGHYREPPSTRFARAALHSWQMELPWAAPELARLRAPIPEDFRGLANELGLRLPEEDEAGSMP
jgi:23S rRNA-/tRNA-specific pseudouridylate synthase